MKSGIYKIQNLVNGKMYVGSSSKIRDRFSQHRSGLRRGIHANQKLQRAWNKYGEENFKFSIILICENDSLLEYEQKIIDIYDVVKNGYNICPVSGTTLGYKASEETRRKIRLAGLGRKHSEETKKKMREAQLGKKKSAEHVKKMADAKRGKKLGPASEEKKKKIGDAHRGRPKSEEQKRKISESLTGRKLPKFSDQRKKNMSDAAKKRWAKYRKMNNG